MLKINPLSLAVLAVIYPISSFAAESATQTLSTITITASADASAQGLSKEFAGGQVAQGGRAGILGTQKNLDTPFSITSYTNTLIQDKQAKSVGEVLQNDAGVRVARGFGNFQESYFIRGFIVGSDDVAYNGLYSLLPRQYIASELFERVEVLRGASTFLNGAAPGGGGGVGGTINLLPKRASNTPLTRVSIATNAESNGQISTDLARRFGQNNEFGVRVNAAYRDGGTSIDDEKASLGVFSVGLDYRADNLRLSGDLGYQDNRLDETRTNVSVNGLTFIPTPPKAHLNFAQPWSYSNERDLFGTFRAEYDVLDNVTAWGAYGFRSSEEGNSLANLSLNNASTGAASTYRFDNNRKDQVNTAELGIKGNLYTGNIRHDWVVSGSYFNVEIKNAYKFDFATQLATNLYHPVDYAQPAWGPNAGSGNELSHPKRTDDNTLNSIAIGDTISLLADQLKVTAGARYQKFNIENYLYGTGALASQYKKDKVSPVFGVVYKLNDELSVYANYIEALNKGATAPLTASNPIYDKTLPISLQNPENLAVLNGGRDLDPYVAKQKEVGIKFENTQLGLDAAYFTTDKPSAYLSYNFATQLPQASFGVFGKDKHQGVELNTYGKLSDDIKILGGLTWLEAKQEKTGNLIIDGKRVIGVPKVQANLGAELAVPTDIGDIAVDGRMVYTGSSYVDALNTLKVEGWDRYDVGARYKTVFSGQDTTLRLRIENLFDKKYWASSGGYPGAGYLVVGAPRTFTLSATFDY